MAEITPQRMMVLTDHDFGEFGRWITGPSSSAGVPKILYSQLTLDIDTFLRSFEENPLIEPPFHNLHSSRLRDAVEELRTNTSKHTKGLSLDVALDSKSYGQIRHGFMFASQGKQKFYPMPAPSEIEHSDYAFYRSMTARARQPSLPAVQPELLRRRGIRSSIRVRGGRS